MDSAAIIAEKDEALALALELANALRLAYGAMNYLGDVLNSHDMADDRGIRRTTPAFDCASKLLADPRVKAIRSRSKAKRTRLDSEKESGITE
jgi:hypothetical protein